MNARLPNLSKSNPSHAGVRSVHAAVDGGWRIRWSNLERLQRQELQQEVQECGLQSRLREDLLDGPRHVCRAAHQIRVSDFLDLRLHPANNVLRLRRHVQHVHVRMQIYQDRLLHEWLQKRREFALAQAARCQATELLPPALFQHAYVPPLPFLM